MVDLVSIPEAAQVLGLNPGRVRAMAAGGQLSASKIGDRWLIERAEVERRRARPVPAGRPFEPHNAWALLLLASGEQIDGLDPSVLSRFRRALALEGVERLGPRLSRRAEVQFLNAHPGELSHILDDAALVKSGISAARAQGFGLVSGEEADGYLPASKAKKFFDDHALSAAGPEGNVRLRVVPDEDWHFLTDATNAPLAAVALDLAEDPDPRSAAAGRAELRRLDRERPAR